MKTVQVEQSATAGQLFDQAAGEPILLKEPTGRVFVLVEVNQDDADSLTLADNPQFNGILNRSRARARREGWLSTEQVRRELNG